MSKMIGEILKQRRIELGFSTYKLGQWLGMSWGNLTKMEETGNPTLKSLEKLSKGLNIEIKIKDGKTEIKKN